MVFKPFSYQIKKKKQIGTISFCRLAALSFLSPTIRGHCNRNNDDSGMRKLIWKTKREESHADNVLRSCFLGSGFGQQLFNFQSPAVH